MEKQNLKEPVIHGTTRFPLATYEWNSEKNLVVKPHWHEETEIVLLKRGSYIVAVNMNSAEITAPAIVFINAGDIHSIEAVTKAPKKRSDTPEGASTSQTSAGPAEQALVFNLGMLSFEHYDQVQAALITPLVKKQLLFPSVLTPEHSAWQELLALIEMIFPAFQRNTTASQLHIKATLLSCIALLYENSLLAEASPIPRATDFRISYMKKILSYIERHYTERITIEDIACEACLNSQYLCRFFKKATGRTLTEHINLVRTEKAAELLVQTNRKILDIAVDCGYNNVSYFIRSFSRYKGASPMQYRKGQDCVT